MQLGSVVNQRVSTQLLHAVPGTCAFRRSGNVVVHAWRGQMTDTIAERFVQINEGVILQHPEGISFVSWIQEGAPLPSSGARRIVSEVMGEYSESIACVAVIMEGSGFWASAMRSAVTGIGLLAKGDFIMRSHRSVAEMTVWFPNHHQARTGVAVAPAHLRELVEQTKRDAV